MKLNLILSGILSSARASLDDAVTLKECDSVDLTRISSPNDYIAAASSSETLEQIEEIVTAWIKQIEQVCCNTYTYIFRRKKKNRLLCTCMQGEGHVNGYMQYASLCHGIFCSLGRNFTVIIPLSTQHLIC